jgi:hypothetical protein
MHTLANAGKRLWIDAAGYQGGTGKGVGRRPDDENGRADRRAISHCYLVPLACSMIMRVQRLLKLLARPALLVAVLDVGECRAGGWRQ